MELSVLDILKTLPLKQNGVVLDIGAGVGKLSKEISLIVPNGQVIALEINKDKIASLQKDIDNNKSLKNIRILNIDVDNGRVLPFKDNSIDAVILAHTLKHIIYRESLLKECSRTLKGGGIILIVESKENAFGVTPHPDARIVLDDILEYLDRAGFLLGKTFDTKHEEYGIIGLCPIDGI